MTTTTASVKEKKEPKEKKPVKEKFWADHQDEFDKFKTFIETQYDVSDTPDLKFKDLMIAYSNHVQVTLPSSWSAKYEAVFNKLNIANEKVVNPRFAQQGGGGTAHVFLRPKSKKNNDLVVSMQQMTIPDINTIPYIPIPK